MLRKNTIALIWVFLSLFSYSIFSHAAPGDIVTSFTINNVSGDGRTPTTPQGITYHDGYLWIVDFGTDRIYRVYPQDVYDTDEVTLLFSAGDSDFNLPIADTDAPPINSDGNPIGTCASATPAGQYCGGGGLTFAENFLWNASPVTDDIIKIDPVDGDNLESENALAALAFPSPTDMTFDGTFFWIVDWQSNTINKVLPEDGTIVDTIPGPSSLPAYDVNPAVTNARPFGIAWDGQALWVTDQQDLMVYRVDPTDGSILNQFIAPGSDPKGLAWDGELLWHVDQANQTVYQVESGVIPFGILGCVLKNGRAVAGDVLLSQTAIPDQATTTDIDGCFNFPSFTSGVPIQVSVSESGVDEKPVIALTETSPGITDVTLIVGDTYSEPGYAATDTEDGDITASVIATPDVINVPALIDTSVPSPPEGYSVDYDVVDSAGNAADTVTRTVYVLAVDITAPVITLNGDNPLYVEQASVFTDPGATATDDRDGDISGDIVVTGSVNANIAGNYTLTYDVSDSTGNAATAVTRDVIVQDTTAPVITLTGANPLTLEKGDAFVDPGATALDNIDGNITASITASGSVTSNTVGSYVISYNVSDAAGNAAATVTRTVDVVDTTIPVITLLGSNPYNQELNTAFTDPGVTASDVPGEDLTASVVVSGSVDTSIAGTYTLTYDVTDTAGNAAVSVSRDVIVADTGAPSITLLGDNPLAQELGSPYTDPGATASDAIDGDLTASIVVGGDVVDPNTTGTYNVTYDVVDSASNPAPTQTRVVNVSDTTPPVITLTGAANILHDLGSTYTDAGATASDNTDGDITAGIVVGGDTVDINTAGIYTITYNVNDAAGNAAAPVTRVVDVADRTAPVITLIGANPLNHEVGTIFNDPGATAADDINGDITANIGVTGAVNANTIGTYTLNYNVSDASGNAATTVTRTVNVVDTGAPAITLNGDNPILHELQTAFTDPGATANDAADGDLTASIVVTGSVDANTAGTYTLTYDVTDSQSNPAPTVTRDVIVADRTAPTITLIGADPINHEQGTAYTDPGASANDIIDGDLSGSIVVTGTVDSNTTGTYTLSYNVSDAAGNAATTVTRDVIVSDTTAPVITLSGANPLSHEVDTVFVDPGATASDNIDGDISGSIGVTGSVNASTIGSYTLTYNVQDSSGNAATTVTRTVNVVDTGAPSITLLGTDPILHELQTPFTDPGATASDAADGDLTASIVVTGSVDPNIAGTYTLSYDVTDSQSNPAPTVTRDVIVADRTAPAITLTGSDPFNVELGGTFTDPGATASDVIDGDLSASIVVTGSVNTSVSGSYVLNYNVSDAAGNAATTVTRTVIVADTTPPVITLTGSNPVNHEVNTIYTDAGATASDNTDGDISGNINVTGSVNASVIGTYILTYNVSDSSGNAATSVTRTVNVADTGAPTITITGSNPVNHEINTAYVDAGATAEDAVDGNITGSIVTVNNVNDAVAGSYTVTYDVTDSQGNPAAQKVRTVNVNDFTAPVITLNGSATVNIQQGSSYTDAGATASDNVDGDLTASIITNGTVDPNTAGTYIISYDVTDAAGNAATQATRTVIVADTTAPVITLIGSNPVNHEQGTVYSDPGASAVDNIDGDLSASITVSGFVDANVAGTYTLSYNVSDAAGNNATTVTRDVIVADTIVPVITLIGSDPINHEQGSVFTDPGASASDTFDGDISASIVVTGTVDSNTAGTYTLSFNVSDAAGNAATTVTRDVIVADTIAPVITLTGSDPINHEQGTAFTDPGATANDSLDGDLTASIIVTGSVNINVSGTYTLSYNVSDAAGNNATTVTRDVIVADTTAPVITRTGSATINHEQGTSYTDAGATASDNIDGDLTASIVQGGSVNVNTAGSYVITYDVSDAAGNAATQVTRTVNVSDTTIPVITLSGANPINHQQGTAFTDPGAGAADNIDGDISGSIVVSGSVNVNVAGTYTLSYNVSDAAGNNAVTVTRDVIVADTQAPVITLIGTNPINHDQGTTFTDPGATASDVADGDLSGSIVVTGSVDTNTAGTYTLSYNVSDAAGNNATTVTRDVIVADISAPVITLTGSDPINQEQGTTFTDPGATATDTLDGDLSASIVVTGSVDINTSGTYTLSYDVSDAAGNNATTVTRDVIVADTIAPTITLLGDASVDHPIGELFSDPGVTATDSFDGDITGSVVTSGSLDVNTEGTYVLSYDVSDAAGNNATTVTRTINVVTPVTVNIEAETATIGGAHTVSAVNAGFSGSGYIEHSGEGYIEYTFSAFAVTYDLTVRYAWDIGDRPLEVILNGVSQGTISFPATGSPTTWLDTATFAIIPQSGTNTLRLQTTGSSGANVDLLTVTPQ